MWRRAHRIETWLLSGIAACILSTAQAVAAEAITTAGATGQAAPQAAAPAAPLGVEAAQPALDDGRPLPADSDCSNAADPERKAHGEVWGGVGNHGYRNAGGAVTLPAGKCSSVSIAVDRTDGGVGAWRR
jgi:hypothetical protein